MSSITVPFFISHQGCPHQCIFCDQRIISSSMGNIPDSAQILKKIDSWTRSCGNRQVEVAFFGGTFTALSQETRQMLLEPLQPLLESGAVASIRVSTRPDSIDTETVLWLADRGVRTVELGIQSLDDAVLEGSGRGYDASRAEDAIRCVSQSGLEAVAQLMPGLPGDSLEKSLKSLERSILSGAGAVRLYPAVVLKGTELARRFLAGEYQPLSVADGVRTCKVLLHSSMLAGVPVIRMGLQADEGLNPQTVISGCWHPAFGQLVRSEMYYDLLVQLLFVSGVGESVEIRCHPSRVSDVAGHGRSNLDRLAGQGIRVKRIVADHSSPVDRIEAAGLINRFRGSILTDLKY